ncbi:hypothetical protein ES703_99249 [subsurface metagenome]
MTTEAQVRGLGDFARYGFTLLHPDDHVLELLHDGELVAHFSQLGATEGGLHHECARHLVMKHGWNGCLWERVKKEDKSDN